MKSAHLAFPQEGAKGSLLQKLPGFPHNYFNILLSELNELPAPSLHIIVWHWLWNNHDQEVLTMGHRGNLVLGQSLGGKAGDTVGVYSSSASDKSSDL